MCLSNLKKRFIECVECKVEVRLKWCLFTASSSPLWLFRVLQCSQCSLRRQLIHHHPALRHRAAGLGPLTFMDQQTLQCHVKSIKSGKKIIERSQPLCDMMSKWSVWSSSCHTKTPWIFWAFLTIPPRISAWHLTAALCIRRMRLPSLRNQEPPMVAPHSATNCLLHMVRFSQIPGPISRDRIQFGNFWAFGIHDSRTYIWCNFEGPHLGVDWSNGTVYRTDIVETQFFDLSKSSCQFFLKYYSYT